MRPVKAEAAGIDIKYAVNFPNMTLVGVPIQDDLSMFTAGFLM